MNYFSCTKYRKSNYIFKYKFVFKKICNKTYHNKFSIVLILNVIFEWKEQQSKRLLSFWGQVRSPWTKTHARIDVPADFIFYYPTLWFFGSKHGWKSVVISNILHLLCNPTNWREDIEKLSAYKTQFWQINV